MQNQESWQLPLASASLDHNDAYGVRLKRVCDLIFAPILLLCCLPLMASVALVVMLESMGSPIYRQDRVGRNGIVFRLYKIRTMYYGADLGGFRTEASDARITLVGRFLRASKIDELPQLWNVIRGDMSLIGPRPLSVEETRHLVADVGFRPDTAGLIPAVLPGLTGLEQCTRSSLHPYEHRFWLNSYYENNVSLWQDLWIIKRTLMVCPGLCLFSVLSGIGMILAFFIYALQ